MSPLDKRQLKCTAGETEEMSICAWLTIADWWKHPCLASLSSPASAAFSQFFLNWRENLLTFHFLCGLANDVKAVASPSWNTWLPSAEIFHPIIVVDVAPRMKKVALTKRFWSCVFVHFWEGSTTRVPPLIHTWKKKQSKIFGLHNIPSLPNFNLHTTFSQQPSCESPDNLRLCFLFRFSRTCYYCINLWQCYI